MPAGDRLRFHDDERPSPVLPNPKQEYPETPVDVRKPWSSHRATKNRDLLPLREILEAEGAPGLEGGEERAKEHINHARMLSPGEVEDQVLDPTDE